MTLRVMVASGDSVGHLSHATTVLDALAERHPLVGAVTMARDSAFRGWVESRGYRVLCAGTTGGLHHELSRAEILGGAIALTLGTIQAIQEARAILDRFRPHLVLGTGGRGSFGPMLAAVARGTPTVTVPHFTPRRANRLLSLVVDRTCITRDADRPRYPALVRGGLRVTGTPLRPQATLTPALARAALRMHPAQPTVGFVGYSRGSPGFREMVPAVIEQVLRSSPGAQFLIQSGAFPIGPECRGRYEQRSFFDPLSALIAACDVLVCAGGETTLLEAAALGVPVVPVSLADTPIGPHVRHLWAELEAAGCARIPAADAAQVRGAADAVAALLADSRCRERMASAGRAYVPADGARRVVEVIEELLVGRGVVARRGAGIATRAA